MTEQTPRIPSRIDIGNQTLIEEFRAIGNKSVPAIYYFETTITYAKLDRLSTNLAAYLHRNGLVKGDRVIVNLQNVPTFWITLLAVWKAGGILVSLNPMYKATEIAYYLDDAKPLFLVIDGALFTDEVRAVVESSSVQNVMTTSAFDLLEDKTIPIPLSQYVTQTHRDTLDFMTLCQTEGQDPQIALGLDDVALLTYTSGTTGSPKGAMNTHKNIAFNAEVYRRWMYLTESDVILGMAPLFHITGLVAHMAVAGLAEIPLILSYRFDAGEMLRLTQRWRGTFTIAAITAFTALMNHPDIKNYDLSTLRKLYSGGAPIALTTIEKFQRITGQYIHNVYGMTETTSPTHAVPLGEEAPVDQERGTLAVGIPIPNTSARIVDVLKGEEVPAGELGEIIVKGPSVVPGYWQKPDETANAIHDGWMYTGDVGLVDENGWFYVVDRKKDLINVSGFKVWPREVEDVLYQHPAVREVAVIGVPDDYRGENVKAFVALFAGEHATTEELIAFCKERMAAYKYPRALTILDELPKTATGKILRRLLR